MVIPQSAGRAEPGANAAEGLHAGPLLIMLYSVSYAFQVIVYPNECQGEMVSGES